MYLIAGFTKNKAIPQHAPIQSLRTDQGHCVPEFFNHSLYQMQLLYTLVGAILREISGGTSY